MSLKIQLFENRRIRTAWDEEREEWYFSIVDVVGVLTDSVDPTAYWRKLKQRLKAEGNETVTNCHGLKMTAPDGKKRLTDVADTEQLLRIIQSIPSPKAEPFKLWLAQVGRERIEETIDPELTIEISKQKAPATLSENIDVARAGGKVAGDARKAIETQTGVPVITSKNAAQLSEVVTNLLEDAGDKDEYITKDYNTV